MWRRRRDLVFGHRHRLSRVPRFVQRPATKTRGGKTRHRRVFLFRPFKSLMHIRQVKGGIWFSGIGIASFAFHASFGGLPRKRRAGKRVTGAFSYSARSNPFCIYAKQKGIPLGCPFTWRRRMILLTVYIFKDCYQSPI